MLKPYLLQRLPIHGITALALALSLSSSVLMAQEQAEAELSTPLPVSLAEAAEQNNPDLIRQLLSQGNQPDTAGEFGTSALHWASYYNSIEAITLLLDAGANPELQTPSQTTALELSIEQASPEAVSLLLEAGASANALLSSGETMLMLASMRGEAEIASLLISHGAQIDTKEEHFAQTALMYAAREGHVELVSILLANGAAPNVSTTIGDAPNFVGANSVPGFGFGVGIIRGGVPADRGRREPIAGGMTPLLYAARHNRIDIARLLLAAGAEIDKSEANGIWPLLMAISNDNTEIAHYLLDEGSLINGQDWYGRSPIWEAVNVRNLYVHNATYENFIDREPYLPLIKALIDAGADLNVRTKETPPFRHHLLEITGSLEWVDFTGQTPFLTAALAGDITVMNLLLEHGADPLIYTFEGTTPLMAAAGVNWVVAQTWTEDASQLLAAVKLCHELGMDVNHVNSMGLSALHGAANRGSNEIIEYLLQEGAQLDAKDNEGRTPLDWAKGVFLATHPDEPKPDSIQLISHHLSEQNKEVR